MAQRMIYVSDVLQELLRGASNASALVSKLLTDHYAGISPEEAIKRNISQLKDEIKLANLSLEKRKVY